MFKNIPDIFVFAAFHGAHPVGLMLRIVHKTAGQPFCKASAAEGEYQG